MLHIGDKDYTVAVPGAKKFYMGSNFIGLAKGDETPTQVQNTNDEPQEQNDEQEKEEE